MKFRTTAGSSIHGSSLFFLPAWSKLKKIMFWAPFWTMPQ